MPILPEQRSPDGFRRTSLGSRSYLRGSRVSMGRTSAAISNRRRRYLPLAPYGRTGNTRQGCEYRRSSSYAWFLRLPGRTVLGTESWLYVCPTLDDSKRLPTALLH